MHLCGTSARGETHVGGAALVCVCVQTRGLYAHTVDETIVDKFHV